MRKSKIRVKLDGLLEHLQAVIYILAARVASSAQIKIIRLRIFRGFARYGLFFLRGKRYSQGLSDTARDFLLDGEHVFQLAVEALGPYGMPGGSFHQLRGDPHAGPRAANGTFEHIRGAKLLACL